MAEKRLIDANALFERLSTLTMYITGMRAGKGVLNKVLTEYRKSFLRIVEEQPTVDVVEVVRCKDCRWSRTNPKDDADVYYCELRTGRAYHSGDFCSYGERRTNG